MTDGISPRIYETLRQLGLTEYGARCYVALLSLRSAEASAIAHAAEVPRTKVYAALKDLVDAGWIFAENGRPVVYRPAPPDERIAQAEKRIEEQADDAVRELQARFALAAHMVPMSVYLIRGREAVASKGFELLGRAREEAILALGFLLPDEAHGLRDAILRARHRGVVVRVLAAPGLDLRALGDAAEGARRGEPPFRATFVDGRQALVAFDTGDETVGLWNPTQTFVELASAGLRKVWESAPRH